MLPHVQEYYKELEQHPDIAKQHKAILKYFDMENEFLISEVSPIRVSFRSKTKPHFIITHFIKVSIRDNSHKINISYSNDFFGDSNVPDYILNFANQLKDLEKNIQDIKRYELSIDDFEDEYDYQEYVAKIDQERYHEDIMMSACESELTPDCFYPTYKEPLTIEGDTLLNIQLGLEEHFEKAGNISGYLQDRIKEAHEKEFKKSDIQNKIEEFGIEEKDLKNLNRIANESGKPTAFLNKLDKYSNTEALEMYHMMTQSSKVIEIFSKDLDEYENEPKQEVTNKRNRGNRPR